MQRQVAYLGSSPRRDPETAYIGISYALRKATEDERRFVTCCSQVFDAEGAGLEFVAYNAREVDVRRDNPFLSRTEMFRVMTRSMDLYRRRHAGVSPRRVMVHKSTEFKEEEVDGCLEALHLCEAVDLIEVVSNTPWRGVRLDRPRNGPKGEPANFPVQRGTLVGIGGREALLWTHGDARGVTSRPSYFQGAREHPSPDPLGSSRGPRNLGRYRTGHSRPHEDELEQRLPV